jgi:hypothetical protein
LRRFVHDLRPNYKLPTRKTVRKIMRAMYARAKLRMRERLSIFVPKEPVPRYAMDAAACISLDGWSSRANRHYVAILLHTLDKSFRLVRDPLR